MLADDNAYKRLKFQRRRLISLPDDTESYLVSPEDIVVNKLRWGRQSQSEKQWRDVLGVLKTQQEQLDYNYMHRWAAEFDLAEALEQVTLEAGVREIADRQWATATYAVMRRAFALTQERDRTTEPSSGVEVAEGNQYVLIQDSPRETLAVVVKLGDRAIAQFGPQGTVLAASPSLHDRRQWQHIAQHLDSKSPGSTTPKNQDS